MKIVYKIMSSACAIGVIVVFIYPDLIGEYKPHADFMIHLVIIGLLYHLLARGED